MACKPRLASRPFALLLLACFVVFGWRELGLGQAAQPRIAKIEIKHFGPPALADALVRGHIRIKEGDPYNPAAIDDDIRALYATGLFYNIRVAEERTRDGVILTYLLQGKPRLTAIKFSGNKKFGDAKLRKRLSSKVGEPLDERKLFNDCLEIQKLYQKSGYPETEVKYTLNIDEAAGRGSVMFEIKESPKTKIIEVQFVGAKAFSQKKLRKVIKTRRYWMFSWLTGSGVLKRDQLEDDKDRLNEFYWERGYIDFELKDVQYEYPAPNKMRVKFIIFEGNQYKVGAISFTGATLLPTNALSPQFRPGAKPPKGVSARDWAEMVQLNEAFRMKEGDVFTPKGLQKNIEAIEDFYGAKGYIDVRAGSPNLRVRKVPNVEKGTIDLEFQITEGQKSYIEKIEIRGNTKTKDRVIRRELAVSPGETFDMVRVKLSQKRLEGLQYFEKVDLRPEPTDIAPNRKNLVVSVEEKPTGMFTVGAGFSSIDYLMGFVSLTQGNFDLFNPPTFMGGGQKARLYLSLGTRRRDAVLTFIEPWFLDQRLELGIDLYHHWLDYQSLYNLYEEVRTGARLSLTKALWRENLIGRLSYTIEDVGILLDPDLASTNVPSTLWAEKGYNLLSRLGAMLAYDTRNSPFLPDRGQRTELMGEITGGLLGGDKDFYRLELRSSWYFRGLARGHVLELSGRAGVADAFGDTPDVPFYDRFYLGGLYSLRGYRYRAIGPKELVGDRGLEPVGGNTYWFGSAEYSIPVIGNERVSVRFAVFYDIGMVYPEPFSLTQARFIDPGTGREISTGSYADNWGVGLRLNLPIGPLRLDYGFPITHDPSVSGAGRFQFGVGYTRQF
ncbi:MAG: outer membrane protein assembly factor BamA [Verrucomicrobiae bacterium]|nr:outer membrane protein assembly factor BamA [Verrucomicrobiae bacterium]